jgi:hypothetical protein
MFDVDSEEDFFEKFYKQGLLGSLNLYGELLNTLGG